MRLRYSCGISVNTNFDAQAQSLTAVTDAAPRASVRGERENSRAGNGQPVRTRPRRLNESQRQHQVDIASQVVERHGAQVLVDAHSSQDFQLVGVAVGSPFTLERSHMSSPITAYIEWFRSLSPEMRLDVAALVGHATPGFSKCRDVMASAPSDVSELSTQFQSVLDETPTTGFEAAGWALALFATTEFFIIRKRESRQQWRETEQLLRLAQAAKFDDMAEQMQLRGDRWVRAC